VVCNVIRFWRDLGVDGLRFDAVPRLIEREGTIDENLPETDTVLWRLWAELDARYTDRMLLAEANEWPEGMLPYFSAGDECHMAFHLPLMPRIYTAVATEDRHPVTNIMRQTPDIPESCQWALLPRYHDELTLSMVSDRERNYLVGPLRGGAAGPDQSRDPPVPGAADGKRPPQDRAAQRIVDVAAGDAGSLLRRRERDGRQCLPRRPQRRTHAGAVGVRSQRRIFLGDTPRRFFPAIIYRFQAVNVETQSRSPSSLLNWTKRLIVPRRSRRAIELTSRPDWAAIPLVGILSILERATNDDGLLDD